MSDLRLPPLEAIIDLHAELIAEHGGLAGIRDRGLLEAAFARPQHLAAYAADSLTPVAAAVALCVGICRNHPFVDGNKRTAFVAAELFLDLNGMTLAASDEDCVLTMLRLAAGEIEEEAFAAWLRANAVRQE